MIDGASILHDIGNIAVGWFITRWYYRRSGSDLGAAVRPLAGDNQKQLQATNALGRSFERAGIIKLAYDATGNLTGSAIPESLHQVIGLTDRATAVVVRGEPPQYDRQHEQPPDPG